MTNEVADAIVHTLQSPNEMDRNLEAANVVDGLFAIARAINRLASVIERVAPTDASQPTDAA